jgi:hypothetical protein
MIVSGQGAVRIAAVATTRLVPAENLAGNSWAQAALLCLRDADSTMANRTALTELGNDMMAARPVDRIGILFDLGSGLASVDYCVRTADADLCALLRAREKAAIAPDDDIYGAFDAAGADYVSVSRLGRIETFGRRPAVVPPLDLPAPPDHTACMAFVPPQQADDAPFDEATYGAFRVLHGIFADPALFRLKQSVIDAVRNGAAPDSVTIVGEEHRAAARVALRQLEKRDGRPILPDRWRETFDV